MATQQNKGKQVGEDKNPAESLLNIDKVNSTVLPGDVIGSISAQQGKIRLGMGLMQNQDQILATKCGILRNKGNRYWVENHQKRYVPQVEDMVVGLVQEKHSENVKVDLGAAALATLPMLAFEGATRKNRPNLQVGTIVYARVIVANKDMEPELVCTASNGKADGFGILLGGYLFSVSLSLARELLTPDCAVLQSLGRLLPFEIAVGLNGRVWVNSGNNAHTILITNAILNSEFLVPQQVEEMVQKLYAKK